MVKYPHFQIGKGKTGIYRIRNIVNNKSYIGHAIDIRKRWLEHLNALRHGIHHSYHLQKSWDKYGEDSFEWTILEECEEDKLIEREQHWMNLFHCADPKFGYNGCPAADSMAGFKFSEASIEKMKSWDRGTLPHAVQIEYRGETKSRSQWARDYGLTPECVRNRMAAGWTIEEALETPVDDNKHFITYQERTQTIKAWSMELGISDKTLSHRLLVKKLSPEEAFTNTPYQGRRTYYTIDGKTQTANEWAMEYGVKPRTIRQRLHNGMELKEALDKPVDIREPKKPKEKTRDCTILMIELKGITKSLPDWCIEYNIGKGTVWNRHNLGWSWEEAVTTPVNKGRKDRHNLTCIICGVAFTSYFSDAKYHSPACKAKAYYQKKKLLH